MNPLPPFRRTSIHDAPRCSLRSPSQIAGIFYASAPNCFTLSIRRPETSSGLMHPSGAPVTNGRSPSREDLVQGGRGIARASPIMPLAGKIFSEDTGSRERPASSRRTALVMGWREYCPGTSQPGKSEHDGVKLLVVPEPGEVQAQWRGNCLRAVPGRVNQPLCAAPEGIRDLTLVSVCGGTTQGRQQ